MTDPVVIANLNAAETLCVQAHSHIREAMKLLGAAPSTKPLPTPPPLPRPLPNPPAPPVVDVKPPEPVEPPQTKPVEPPPAAPKKRFT